jgi:hypothetical protein
MRMGSHSGYRDTMAATRSPMKAQADARDLVVPDRRPDIVMRFSFCVTLPFSPRRPVEAVLAYCRLPRSLEAHRQVDAEIGSRRKQVKPVRSQPR